MQPTAGSLDAVLSEFDIYGRREMAACRTPFALSPIVHGPLLQPPHRTNWMSVLGTGYDQQLGALTDFEQSSIDVPLVERSWGLLDKGRFYGPNFQYEELKPVSSRLAAFTGHLKYTFLMFCLSLAPVRWLLRRIAPTAEENSKQVEDILDVRA